MHANKPKTPLPIKQMAIIVLVRLSEPIAFTFLFPFLYFMVRDFNFTKDPREIGYYVGTLAASFAIAQVFTGLLWGYISDRVGRKPVILLSLIGVGCSLISFGFSKNLTNALISRFICGATTGSVSSIKSMVGELTDSTNRAEAFSYLPMTSVIGSIIGPAIGGILANPAEKFEFFNTSLFREYPYLLPCLICSSLCFLSFLIGCFYLKETLNVQSSKTETLNTSPDESSESCALLKRTRINRSVKQIIGYNINCDTLLAVMGAAGLTFQSVFHDELFPLWAATSVRNGGLSLTTSKIGTILSITGFISFVLQCLFNARIQNRFGCLKTYKLINYFSVLVFVAYPFVQMLSGKEHEYLFFAALIFFNVSRAICNIFGLTSVNLIMVQTSEARRLGFINGLDQTCRSIARAIAPLLCGSLWSWSITNGLKYPFNSYLNWNALLFIAVINTLLAGFVNKSSQNR